VTNGGERGGASHLRVLSGGAARVAIAAVDPEAASPDDALLQAFIDGDDDAFEDLVRRYEELVLKIVRRFSRDTEDARDLAQRTFVRAFEAARRTFARTQEPRVPFRRWVIRIAINLAKNHARDQNRWLRAPATALDAQHHRGAEPLASLIAAERVGRVRLAILRLPRRQREVVALRLDAELPFSEIAAALDISENAARVSFHHAAVQLRSLATEEDEP
jgi:RNA polymerase sigma-70 factor (ECF subfamily)